MDSHRFNISKVSLIVLFAFTAIGITFYLYLDSIKGGYDTYAVLADGYKIEIEVANTDELRAYGLSGRDKIEENKGMYFLFPREDRYGFWMRDMQFPIDVLWLKKSKVIGFEENVDPEIGAKDNELKIYYPPDAIATALELKAGMVFKHNIKVGDIVEIKIVSKN